MSFKDLDEFFDPTLKLPIGGKTYVIQPVDAETGLWIQTVMGVATRSQSDPGSVSDDELESLKLSDEQERNIFKRAMGDTFDEMVTDRLDWPRIQLAGTTALFWISSGTDAAEAYWHSGGVSPKAQPKAPQDRKPKKALAKKAQPASRAGTTHQK